MKMNHQERAIKNVITPLLHSTPLLTVREHVQHVDNGNQFRGPCVLLVGNVITPVPHSTHPVDRKRVCATYCNVFTTERILQEA